MKNAMMTPEEVSKRIEAGAVLFVAGSRAALSKLPKGKWIGGTSVYFMTETGGRTDRENVFVTEIEAATDARPVLYQGEDLPNLAMGRFDTGMSMIVIPGFSAAHQDYANNCPMYPGLFEQPIMGWIAGVHLDDIGDEKPAVVDGATGELYEDGAMVLHVALPADKVADIDIVNLFEPDTDGDEITFAETGFGAKTAFVNGKEVDFAAYVQENELDISRPLVANAAGALVNVSFQAVDAETGVAFYAPVIAGESYHHAKPLGDYAQSFAAQVTDDSGKELACNCILNYVYGELEGKTTGKITGPATFGEIAYILLNQTLVRLDVVPAAGSASAVA